jgi:peptidoglycan hydrolase-like protein with peptidoglycan-binding domain
MKISELEDEDMARALSGLGQLVSFLVPPGTTLRSGSSGPLVTALQQFLNGRGFGVDVDGKFGPQTEDGVKLAQNKAGIAATGTIDASMGSALLKLPSAAPVPVPKRPSAGSGSSGSGGSSIVKVDPSGVQTGAGAGAGAGAEGGGLLSGSFEEVIKKLLSNPWVLAGLGIGAAGLVWWLMQPAKGTQQIAAVETLSEEELCEFGDCGRKKLAGVSSKRRRARKAGSKKAAAKASGRKSKASGRKSRAKASSDSEE